jgi:hypothetical protein
MVFAAGALLLIVIALFFALVLPQLRKPLPSALLAIGKVYHIEGVTYGTDHHMGFKSLLENFRPWLPASVRSWVDPSQPRSEMHLDHAVLVVWVNATDPVTGKYVDCQDILMEIVGQNRDTFPQSTTHWFGSAAFWRAGHVFDAYPREQRVLSVRITPWRTNMSVLLEVPNPHVIQPASWSGEPLPQHKTIGDLEVTLKSLILSTNSSGGRNWKRATARWTPSWELRQAGKPAVGWEEPEWIAEDPTGNRSQFLGLHQKVVRFSATCYPIATNTQAAVLLGTSPAFSPATLQSNVWWNLKLNCDKRSIPVLGVFTNGVHVFLDGVYQTNPAVKMGAVRGGAPSGWTGQSRRVSPSRVDYWSGHYTPVPVIYAQAKELNPNERLAVRLRDDAGHYWLAKPEPQGNNHRIQPFLLELPSEVKTVVAEFVLLRPVQADFLVQMPLPPSPAPPPQEQPGQRRAGSPSEH